MTSSMPQLPWEGPRAGSTALCMRDPREELSYAEVESRAAAFADQLTALGVGAGDIVAIMIPNSVRLLIGMLGAWRVGAAVTPINPTFTERELTYQLEDSKARILIGTPPVTLGIPVISPEDMQLVPGHIARPDIDEDALALVVYTSGSTGRPKGVELLHRHLRAMAASIVEVASLTADDQALLVLPLFHVNSVCVSFLAPMYAGGSLTVLERFAPTTFIEALRTYRPTYFSAVPAIFAHLAALPEEVQIDASSLRFALCGAAPASPELLERCERRFGIDIVEGYGLTEATCASACTPVGAPRRAGSVGPAMPGQSIRIVDPAGRTLPAGERGEVVISGDTVMAGYLGRPEATSETITDGWLHTGDVGVLDEDGYLRIVDRIKDMIIRGGENIYPKEIESVLATHPAVLEAAVVGRPHEVLGELPVAYVVLAPSETAPTVDELLAHCRAGLTKIKVPVELTILDELPRNPVGKLDKPALRRQLLAAV